MLTLPTTSKSPHFSLPQRLVWDVSDPKQREEIDQKANELIGKGFRLVEMKEGEILLEPPVCPSDECLCRVLDPSGDSRLVWNRNNLDEIKEAKKKFESYIQKGYKAYACRRDGSRGSRIESFDALMEELLIESNKGGSKSKAEGVLVPPTSPG